MTPVKIVLTLGLLLSLTAPAFGQGKTATIDLKKVFENYWKKNEADNTLQERAAEMDKEFKTLAEGYKKSKDEFTKLQALASDQAVAIEERDRRKKAAEAKLLEIRESEQTIESFRRQASATLDEQKRRMRDKIIGEIKSVATAKAKSSSFTMVLDVSAESLTSTPVLVYSNGENDITDEVLTQLNATAPASATKPAVKPAAKPAPTGK